MLEILRGLGKCNLRRISLYLIQIEGASRGDKAECNDDEADEEDEDSGGGGEDGEGASPASAVPSRTL